MTRLPSRLFGSPLPGLGRPITAPEGDLATNYLNILTKWQRSQRLVGSVEPAWLVDNVLLDSLCFLGAVPSAARLIVDVGSGAGIPGIPIAIVAPHLRLALIESRQRRVSFLSTVVRELALENVDVIGCRVQELAPMHTGRYDAAVMRCAGELSTLLPSVLPLLKAGGVLVVSSKADRSAGDGELVEIQTLRGGVRVFKRFTKGGATR